MNVPVVENPRKRRRRRLTPKQIAAGFGGRSRMGGKSRRRRRNPALATLAGNPRRRRRRRLGAAPRRYRRRSYRNPSMFGVDLGSVLWVTTGVIGSNLLPNLLVKKVWATMPATGLTYHAVRAGSVLAAGFAVRKFLKQPKAATGFMVGGLAAIAYDLYKEFVAPKLGLSGLGYDDTGYISSDELMDVIGGTSGFIQAPQRLSGFVDVPAEILAA